MQVSQIKETIKILGIADAIYNIIAQMCNHQHHNSVNKSPSESWFVFGMASQR